MKKIGWLLLAACAGAASAQDPCPRAEDVGQAQMLGTWQAEFEGAGPVGTLVLAKHATYAGSLSGSLERDGERRQVTGDVEDGEFTLEESLDGRRISGTWLGDVVDGSCGREIRGTWKAEGETAVRAFVLRKQ